MEAKKDKIYKIIMLIIITSTLTFMITSIGMYNYYTKTEKGKNQIISRMDLSDDNVELKEKLEIVNNCLSEYYIGEFDIKNMEEYAIKGYVAGVKDEYTSYLTKDEYEDLLINVNGDYVGIGIYMYTNEDGNIVVLEPIENSPAEEVGLKPNDIIISIDGESCEEMDANIASSKIKGQEGTKVELEILRGNETINKTIERRRVEIADSKSEILDGNIGYIQLSTFDEECSKKVLEYLNQFQEKKVKSVIIDLRDNTGGVVTEAINFSEIFLNNGDIIMRTYDKKNKESIKKAKEDKKNNMKIVLLVNGYSASATEIVTAALKDNKAATIVGTTTYGKGVMQEILPLFKGALKITIEEFKTPKGEKINKVGIIPDIIIEDDPKTEKDEQLQKAIELCK